MYISYLYVGVLYLHGGTLAVDPLFDQSLNTCPQSHSVSDWNVSYLFLKKKTHPKTSKSSRKSLKTSKNRVYLPKLREREVAFVIIIIMKNN